mmetsp:Transcript_12911/g.35805  ORF Transcript_12911/g.35805 Transcript_12911/m.35805 type:complete len:218 (+) Transcript_12911:3137-3790(+)
MKSLPSGRLDRLESRQRTTTWRSLMMARKKRRVGSCARRSTRSSMTRSRYLRSSMSSGPSGLTESSWVKKWSRSQGRKSSRAAPTGAFLSFLTRARHFFSSAGACRSSSCSALRLRCFQSGSATWGRHTPRTVAFSRLWKQLTRKRTTLARSRWVEAGRAWSAMDASKSAGKTAARSSNTSHTSTCCRNFSLMRMMMDETWATEGGGSAAGSKLGQR